LYNHTWWSEPSLEHNGFIIEDRQLLDLASSIVRLGQCSPRPTARWVMPGIAGTAVASLLLATIALRMTQTRGSGPIETLRSLDILLSTAVALPATKVAHLLWRGFYYQIVDHDWPAWQSAHPNQPHVIDGYPLAFGSFGTSGIFLAALTLQVWWLTSPKNIQLADSTTQDPIHTPVQRLRNLRFLLLLATLAFFSWPLLIGWLARIVPQEFAEKYIPF